MALQEERKTIYYLNHLIPLDTCGIICEYLGWGVSSVRWKARECPDFDGTFSCVGDMVNFSKKTLSGFGFTKDEIQQWVNAMVFGDDIDIHRSLYNVLVAFNPPLEDEYDEYHY